MDGEKDKVADLTAIIRTNFLVISQLEGGEKRRNVDVSKVSVFPAEEKKTARSQSELGTQQTSRRAVIVIGKGHRKFLYVLI